MTTSDTTPPISDSAVQAATGRTWAEWFALLDGAGAAALSHREIVALVAAVGGVGGWWQQMVTVTYEQARGLREKHQRPDGYQVGGSRTIAVPVERLFDAWHDDHLRARWLPEAITIRKATPARSLRIAWGDGQTHVDVNLYAKGPAKSQVSLQHSRLPDAEGAERQKAYWAEALGRLKELLEGPDAAGA